MLPDFLNLASSAAMVTLRPDGTPHVARCAIAAADGRLLSTVLPDAVRVRHVRRDNRATLFLYDPFEPARARDWMAADSIITLHEGTRAAELCLEMRKVLQARFSPAPEGKVIVHGEIMSEGEYLAAVTAEGRLAFEFEVLRTYGIPADPRRGIIEAAETSA